MKLFISLFPRRVLGAVGLALGLFGAAAHADYSQHPKASTFIDRMHTEHGIAKSDTVKLLAGLERYDAVIEAMSRPAEKTLTWAGYRPIFLLSLIHI